MVKMVNFMIYMFYHMKKMAKEEENERRNLAAFRALQEPVRLLTPIILFWFFPQMISH